MKDLYDAIIIGGGPAGLTAAIYAGRSRMKTLLIEQGSYGGRVKDTSLVANYSGFKKIPGRELMEKFKDHAENFPSVSWLRSTVTEIVQEGNINVVRTKRKGDFYSKSVILAMGTKPRVLGIPGEIEFVGKGVAYCATCDAEFFKNQIVYVLGAGDQAVEEAGFITRFAKKVYIIVLHEEGHLDCNEVAADQAYQNNKIEFIWNSTLKEIRGDDHVEQIVIENVVTKERSEHQADGVFFFVGMTPQTDIVKNLVQLDGHKFIPVDASRQTNAEGIFAAGDVTDTYLRQIITSGADGAIAAVAAERYVKERDFIEKLMADKEAKLAFIFYSPYETAMIDQVSDAEELLKGKLKVIRQDISRQTGLYKKLEVSKLPSIALYQGDILQRLMDLEELEQIVDTLQNDD